MNLRESMRAMNRLVGRDRNPAPAVAPIDIPEPFGARLVSMFSGEPQVGEDGRAYPLDGVTSATQPTCMWLYQLCLEERPKKTLEVGLAYGFSTVSFLAAIARNNIGHHTAVDPFERSAWHGIGLANVRTLGMEEKFRFVDAKSVPALANFGEAGERFDVIFIDGNHRFDDALVDFTLGSELCPQGGYIALDDMWLPSIRKVVAFIRTNRKDFVSVETPTANIAAFRRVGLDGRSWNHFEDFTTVR